MIWLKEGETVREEDLNMKGNEKVTLYISTFQTCFKKSPYPTHQNLKLWSCNGNIR